MDVQLTISDPLSYIDFYFSINHSKKLNQEYENYIFIELRLRMQVLG